MVLQPDGILLFMIDHDPVAALIFGIVIRHFSLQRHIVAAVLAAATCRSDRSTARSANVPRAK
jgi:hypothetical protein